MGKGTIEPVNIFMQEFGGKKPAENGAPKKEVAVVEEETPSGNIFVDEFGVKKKDGTTTQSTTSSGLSLGAAGAKIRNPLFKLLSVVGAEFNPDEEEGGILADLSNPTAKGSSESGAAAAAKSFIKQDENSISNSRHNMENGIASFEDFLNVQKLSPRIFENIKSQLNIPLTKEELPEGPNRDDNYAWRVFQDYKNQVSEDRVAQGRIRREGIGRQLQETLPLASEFTGNDYQPPTNLEEAKKILSDIDANKSKLLFIAKNTDGSLNEMIERAKQFDSEVGKVDKALPALTQVISGFVFDEESKNNPNVTTMDVGKKIYEIINPKQYAIYKEAGGDQIYRAGGGFGQGYTETPKKADAINRDMMQHGINAFNTFGNKTAVQAADFDAGTLNWKYTKPVEEETKHMIAAELLSQGIKPNRATDEQKDAIAETLPELNRNVWFEKNRSENNVALPSTGFGYSLGGSYHNTVEDATKTLLGWMMPNRSRERALDVLEEQGTSRIAGENPESVARLDQLRRKEKEGTITGDEIKEKENLEQYTDLRTGWQKFKDLSGSGVGQFAGFGTISAFTGGLGNARNVGGALKALVSPMADRGGMLVGGYLMSRESNARDAAAMFPGEKDGLKRFVYGEAASAIDTYIERLFPEEKFLSGVAKKNMVDLIPKLTAQNIRKELNEGLAKKIAKTTVAAISEQQKTPIQEGLEESISAGLKDVFRGILDPDRDAMTMDDIIKVGTQAYLSTQVLGVPKGVMAQSNKHVPINAIWDVASNRGDYFDTKFKILEMKANGDITEHQANERISLLNTAKKNYEDNPILSGNMGNLPLPKRQNYLARLMNEQVLQKEADAATDENVKRTLNEQISESKKARKAIYDGDVYVTETNDEKITNPELKKVNDQWKTNIVAIGERTDIDETEKERLKQIEDQRHAVEVADMQTSPNEIIVREAGKNGIGIYSEIVKADPSKAEEVLLDYAKQKYGLGDDGTEREGESPKIANPSIERAVTRAFPDKASVQAYIDGDDISSKGKVIGEEIAPVLQRINDADYINEAELDESANKLYEALDAVDKSKMTPEQKESSRNLIEPLIQKIEGYEFRTKTETGTVTEKVPTGRTNKTEIKIRPALEQSEGSPVTVRTPDGNQVSGILSIKSGSYVVDVPKGTQRVLGEKAITDRDLQLPSAEEMEDPIQFDENGNVKSVTFKIKNGNLITIEDPGKALDISIQLYADTVGEIPDGEFQEVYDEVVKTIPVEVLVNSGIETTSSIKGEGASPSMPVREEKPRQNTEDKKAVLIQEDGKSGGGESPLTETGESVDDEGVGITHAATEYIREQYDLGSYDKGEQENVPEWDRQATERIKAEGIQPLLKKLRGGGIADKIEQRMMLQYIAQLDKNASENSSNENLKKLLDAIQLSDQVSGSEWGRAGVARKGRKKADDSLASWFIREMEEEGVDELTTGQKLTVQKEWEEINKAKKEFEDWAKTKEDEINQREAGLTVEEFKKKKGTRSHDLAKQREQIISDILLKFNDPNITSFLGAGQLRAIAPDVLKLARNIFESGAVKLADVTEQVYNVLKDKVQGIERKDINAILGGVYNEKKNTKNELTAQWNDLKEEAKLIERLDALERGEEPKNEKKKIERNREITELRKQIKAHDITQLSQAKTRIQAQINKIEDQLKSGDFSKAEPKKIIFDDEGRGLQKRLIDLQKNREIRIEKAKYEQRTKQQKLMDHFIELANFPRSLMASMDISAPLNQAAVATTAYPKIAADAFRQMFSAMKNSENFDRWFNDLKDSPRYGLMNKTGLKISDPHSPFLLAREEAFLSGYAEQASKALFGKLGLDPIGASNRAYVQYLNKMRVDLFNKFANQFEAKGKTYENNPKLYDKMSRYINAITGAGHLGPVEEYAGFFNALFFSPRLIASRLRLLNPAYVASLPKPLLASYFKDMGLYVATRAAIIGGLAMYAKYLQDDDEDKITVETDPRSSDFGKVRQGNTRWDLWGGFQPYVRLAAQVTTGERKTTTSGAIQDINVGEELLRFGRGKLAPIWSTGLNVGLGENVVGEKTTVGSVIKSFMPLGIQAMAEGWGQYGAMTPLKVFAPSAMGLGVQTYQPKEKEVSREVTITKKDNGTYIQFKAKLNDKQAEEYETKARKYMEESIKKLESDKGYQELNNTQKAAMKRNFENAAIRKAEKEIVEKYGSTFKIDQKQQEKAEQKVKEDEIKNRLKE